MNIMYNKNRCLLTVIHNLYDSEMPSNFPNPYRYNTLKMYTMLRLLLIIIVIKNTMNK